MLITPGWGSTPAQMTPNRTTLKPLSAKNCASSSSKPLTDGSYGASLYTSLTPCRMTTCPSLVVSQVPVCDSGGSGSSWAGSRPPWRRNCRPRRGCPASPRCRRHRRVLADPWRSPPTPLLPASPPSPPLPRKAAPLPPLPPRPPSEPSPPAPPWPPMPNTKPAPSPPAPPAPPTAPAAPAPPSPPVPPMPISEPPAPPAPPAAPAPPAPPAPPLPNSSGRAAIATDNTVLVAVPAGAAVTEKPPAGATVVVIFSAGRAIADHIRTRHVLMKPSTWRPTSLTIQACTTACSGV